MRNAATRDFQNTSYAECDSVDKKIDLNVTRNMMGMKVFEWLN
jgi:hypothetical protein